MELGDRLATEPAPEGSRQGDHMDRTPPHRGRGDGHRQRGWNNKGLVSPQMTEKPYCTKFPLPVRSPTATFPSIEFEITSQIEDRARTYGENCI